MKLGTSFSSILKKAKLKRKKGPRVPLRRAIPLLYAKIVFVGLALTGMQASFLPQLVICSSLFGDQACDPVGNYVVALSSLPGYLFTGKIISFWPTAPTYAFFAILFSFSLIIYYLLGLLADKRKGTKMDVRGVVSFIVFAALLVLLAMLFALI